MGKRAIFKRLTDSEGQTIFTSGNPLLEGEVVYVTDSLGTLLGIKQGRKTPLLNDWNSIPLVSFGGNNPKQNQQITFAAIDPLNFLGNPITLAATVNSGLPITFTLASGDEAFASLLNGVLTIIAPGTITITATQAGDINYNTITAEQSVVINKAEQTIAFNDVTSVSLTSGTLQFEGIASSGLPIVYESSNTGVLTVDSSGLATLIGTGSVNITLSQAGSSNYLAAPNVVKTITITA